MTSDIEQGSENPTPSDPVTADATAEPQAGRGKWRKGILIHPAAERLELQSDDTFARFFKDIKRDGQRVPVVFWVDATAEEYRKSAGTIPLQLIDGRNRLDALELAGVPILTPKGGISPRVKSVIYFNDTNPYALVASLNIHRRNLSRGQIQAYIDYMLEKSPELSDRAIATATGTSPPTVGKRRKKAEAAGRISPITKRKGQDNRTTTPAPRRGKRSASADAPTVKVLQSSTSDETTPESERGSEPTGPSTPDADTAPQQNGEASEQAQLKERFRAFADLVTWLAADNHPVVDELEHLAGDDEGIELRKLLARNLVTAYDRLSRWVGVLNTVLA